MPKYTTGEMAKLCGVSVRTVQYYDARKILLPSALSEGGRRLYSEEDLQRLRIICFLREAGLPINSISRLFSEEDPGSVIDILLTQQAQTLRDELEERQTQLAMVEQIRRELKNVTHFSVESIGDIAYIMESRRMMYRVRATMLCAGLFSEAVELGLLLLWIIRGIWWPYVAWLPVTVGIAIWLSVFYFHRVDYICPQCHSVFRPDFREMFFARHTPSTRRLTCTHCGHKGFCVETYRKEYQANE